MMKSGLQKLRLNSPGVLEILKSGAVQQDMARRGNAIKSGLPTDNGEEWFLTSSIGKDRAFTIVGTNNTAAKLAAAENHALQRAMDRGR